MINNSSLLPRFISAAVTVLFLVSCGGSDEDPLLLEKKAMEKMQAENKVEFYRAFKVALRSYAVDSTEPGFAEARKALLGTAGNALHVMDSASAAKTNLLEMASNAKALYDAKDVLLKTDEDSLPTILESIFAVGGKGLATSKDNSLFSGFGEDEEHLFLGATYYVSHKVPKSFMLYEIYRVHDERLSSTEMRIGSKLLKSIAWIENKWPYHAELAANEYIALFDNEKSYLLSSPLPSIDTAATPTPEKSWHQWRAIGYALLGAAHMQMEDKEKQESAYDDFALFLKDAEAGGLDNELTWTIGAVVAVKGEDKEKALGYLSKLETSKILSAEEKEAATSIKKYVEKRDNESALNSIYDKLAIAKIAGSYAVHRANAAKPVERMQQTEAGKKFTDLSKQAEHLAPLGTGMADSLLKKTGDKIKDLFK
jgi:hypothetical protein